MSEGGNGGRGGRVTNLALGNEPDGSKSFVYQILQYKKYMCIMNKAVVIKSKF